MKQKDEKKTNQTNERRWKENNLPTTKNNIYAVYKQNTLTAEEIP